jgi:hypothetical protein
MSNVLIHRGYANGANGCNSAVPVGECSRIFSPDIRERRAHDVTLRVGLSRTTAQITMSNSSVRMERLLPPTNARLSGAEIFDESL